MKEHDNSPIGPVLLTTKQTCEHLGIGKTSLYRLRKEGKVKTIKFFADVRYDINDLNDFINNNRSSSSDNGKAS